MTRSVIWYFHLIAPFSKENPTINLGCFWYAHPESKAIWSYVSFASLPIITSQILNFIVPLQSQSDRLAYHRPHAMRLAQSSHLSLPWWYLIRNISQRDPSIKWPWQNAIYNTLLAADRPGNLECQVIMARKLCVARWILSKRCG